MEQKQAQEYFNTTMGKFKTNPDTEELSNEEKVFLRNIMLLASNIDQLTKDLQSLEEEKTKKYNELIFNKGKMQGVVDALVQLKAMNTI